LTALHEVPYLKPVCGDDPSLKLCKHTSTAGVLNTESHSTVSRSGATSFDKFTLMASSYT
jgi:hypothetical protein